MIFIAFGLGVVVTLSLELIKFQILKEQNEILEAENMRLKKLFEQFQRSE